MSSSVKTDKLLILIGSFNLQRKPLDFYSDLKDWLNTAASPTLAPTLEETPEKPLSPPDIICIGLQESSYYPWTFLNSTWYLDQNVEVCFQLLKATYGLEYVNAGKSAWVGLTLLLFIRPGLEFHLSHQARVGVGPLWMGNKGALLLRVNCLGQDISFISAHLEAHAENYSKRNAQVVEILKRLPVPVKDGKIFFFGDLNYRVAMVDGVVDGGGTGGGKQALKSDQLARAKTEHPIIRYLQEPAITFDPTYKFDKEEYDRAKTPSWCDRILYFSPSSSSPPSRKIGTIEGLSYWSCKSFGISDHLPVAALFRCTPGPYPCPFQLVPDPKSRWKLCVGSWSTLVAGACWYMLGTKQGWLIIFFCVWGYYKALGDF